MRRPLDISTQRNSAVEEPPRQHICRLSLTVFSSLMHLHDHRVINLTFETSFSLALS